jgi:hypothetical protein
MPIILAGNSAKGRQARPPRTLMTPGSSIFDVRQRPGHRFQGAALGGDAQPQLGGAQRGVEGIENGDRQRCGKKDRA